MKANQKISEILIDNHSGICVPCIVVETNIDSTEVIRLVKSFESVAPVIKRYDRCNCCGKEINLYSIHYPIP